jgi:hypothetical protein
MYGREPRTRASAAVGWADTLELPAVNSNDVNEMLAAHHAQLNAVQGRVHLASSLAQALTKREWDAARTPGEFVVGQWVLLHTAAPNRLAPHFTGPYQIVTVTADGNFVTGRYFAALPGSAASGPYHVSRLLPFEFTRAGKAEVASFLVEDGYGVVVSVHGHRQAVDGTYELNLRWCSGS